MALAAGMALTAAALSGSAGSPAASQGCPAPRVSQWGSIRDSLWPRVTHRAGDERWAHLDSLAFPGQTGAWCNPLAGDAQAIAGGRNVYVTHECANCHGELGRGDGPGAAVMDPPPYDFTQAEFAGMREAPGTAVLYAIMTHGIHGTTMQGYGDQLSGWERLAVIAYLTSLPGPEAARHSRAWADSLRRRRAGP